MMTPRDLSPINSVQLHIADAISAVTALGESHDLQALLKLAANEARRVADAQKPVAKAEKAAKATKAPAKKAAPKKAKKTVAEDQPVVRAPKVSKKHAHLNGVGH